MKAILRRVRIHRYPLIFFILGVIGLAYLLGYFTAEHKLFPQRYLAKIDSIAVSVIKQYILNIKPVAKNSIATIFVNLKYDEIEVPVSRKGAGGGLTSFGDELLLITHEGRIFLATEDEVEPTQIVAPTNGLDEYIAASRSEKYKNLEHKFIWFRYNDILYYSENDRHGLVVSYTEWLPKEECYGTTIAQLELPPGIKSIMEVKATADDWKIVYRTQPCLKLKSIWRALEGHMAGGRIAYRQPNKIILGSGDYAWDGVYAPEAYAQKTNNDYGKVLEIDLTDGTSRKISIGHRNMQGVIVDSKGQIWVTEHGPRGGDELNRVIEGGNFGWPKVVLGTRYNRLPWPGSVGYGRHDNYIAPTYAWVPSIATSGLTQIEGFAPGWDGDLLVSSLKATSIFRLRIKENRVIFAEPIKIGERIRYVHQHTDGRIVLWTDSKKLIFISLGTESYTQERIDKAIADAGYNDHQRERIESAIGGCAECHSFEENVHEGAPSLSTIFGRRVASTEYNEYSDALRSRQGAWTADQLSQFIKDPQTYAPGTSMPNPGIKDSFVIDGIVYILETLRNDAE